MPVFVPESDPTAASWKSLLEVAAPIGASTAAQTMLLGYDNWATNTSQTTGALPTLYLDPTVYAVANRTTRLRVIATVMTNATAPATNYTFGLYPIASVAGASGGISFTVGTVVTGSTGLITAPALSTRSQVVSSSFSFPAVNYHALGLVTSATSAASSWVQVTAALQIQLV